MWVALFFKKKNKSPPLGGRYVELFILFSYLFRIERRRERRRKSPLVRGTTWVAPRNALSDSGGSLRPGRILGVPACKRALRGGTGRRSRSLSLASPWP